MCWIDWPYSQFSVSATAGHHPAAHIARSAAAPTVSCAVKYLQNRDTCGQCWCWSVSCCRWSAGHFHRSAGLCFPAGKKGLLCVNKTVEYDSTVTGVCMNQLVNIT